MIELKSLAEEAARFSTELQSVRRDIHRHPELGLEVPKTLDRVLASISSLPIEISRSDSGSAGPMTSAVVRISGKGEGPTVLLRADLDGLALQEDTGLEFASELPGRMHACGHDLHAAIAVGAIHLLTTHRDQLNGEVIFMLQPGEEGYRGADHMIEDGLLRQARGEVLGAFALHVTTNQPLGKFVTRPGTLMAAAAELNVVVKGAGGHGSAPHLARDPNQTLAEIVSGLQTMVTRRFSAFDPVIITIGWMAGGQPGTNNVIPNSAAFGATIRTFSPKHLAEVEIHARELVAGIAGAYGLETEIEFKIITVPLQNDAASVELAEKVALEMFGPERFEILESPIGGAEDFASVLREVPGAFVFVGACPPELDPETAPNNHSNLALFDDSVLPDASAYLAALAFAKLNS